MKPQTLFFLLPAVAADFATVFPVFSETCQQCLTTPYEACLPESSASFVECICATQAQAFIQCMGGTTCDHGDDFAAANGWLAFCINAYTPIREAYCNNSTYATRPIQFDAPTDQLCAAKPSTSVSSSSETSSSSKATSSSEATSSSPTTPGCHPTAMSTTSALTTLKPAISTKAAGPITPTSTTKPHSVIVSGGDFSQKTESLSLVVCGIVTVLLWI